MLSALLVTLTLATAPHADSVSRSELSVRGGEARLLLRFQSLSAIEVLPELDADGDQRLDAGELERGRERLENYLLARWQLRPAGGSEPASGVVEGLRVEESAFRGPLSLQWMAATIRFELAGSSDGVTVESRLFHERNPFHADYVRVTLADEEPIEALFRGDRVLYTFEPEAARRPGVLADFLGLGFHHILGGYDHLAFLLALLVAAPRLRSLVGVVTAFTIAHSITLAWTALDPGGFLGRVPGRLVELAIALSIAYVACDNLLRRRPHTTLVEAFVFGLLHGLGFAGFLREILGGEPLVLTALVGFNLGVEAGQLLVVLPLAGLFALLGGLGRLGRRAREDDGEPELGLVPTWFRLSASAVVAVLGFFWFVERAGWV